MGKIIIIAPHPDDEIFAIKKVKAIQNKNDSVSILFLSGDTPRLDEAKESCKYLGFEPLTIQQIEPNLLRDGFFHEKIKELITILEGLCQGFNWYSRLRLKEAIKTMTRLPWLYYVHYGRSKEITPKFIFIHATRAGKRHSSIKLILAQRI